MITGINSAIWQFIDCNGGVLEQPLEPGTDVENICCQLASITGLPTKAEIKLHTHNDIKRGEIII